MAEINEDKKVDESWKQKMAEEKQKDTQAFPPPPEDIVPEADFNTFLYGLGTQAMVSLGQIESPATGKKETKLNEAKYLIDILKMLKDKTQGQLTDAEKQNFEALICSLQLVYVKQAK
jgi:hypothetical protein